MVSKRHMCVKVHLNGGSTVRPSFGSAASGGSNGSRVSCPSMTVCWRGTTRRTVFINAVESDGPSQWPGSGSSEPLRLPKLLHGILELGWAAIQWGRAWKKSQLEINVSALGSLPTQ